MGYSVDRAIETVGLGQFQYKILLASAFLFMSDAMEMMLLSFVSPTLRCDWDLPDGESGLVTVVVFLGFMLGAPFWGIVADRLGRKLAMILGCVGTVGFGLLSALSPNIEVLCILRFGVGFALSSSAVSTAYMLEHLPSANRGRWMMLLCGGAWPFGAGLEALLAWAVLPLLGWRWLVVLSTIPLLLCILIISQLSDSPRSLMIRGKAEEAATVLQRMASENGTSLPDGELEDPIDPMQNPGGHGTWATIKNVLCSRQLRFTTFLVTCIFFGCGLSYYGGVLLATEIMAGNHDGACGSMDSGAKSPFSTNDFLRSLPKCLPLSYLASVTTLLS